MIPHRGKTIKLLSSTPPASSWEQGKRRAFWGGGPRTGDKRCSLAARDQPSWGCKTFQPQRKGASGKQSGKFIQGHEGDGSLKSLSPPSGEWRHGHRRVPVWFWHSLRTCLSLPESVVLVPLERMHQACPWCAVRPGAVRFTARRPGSPMVPLEQACHLQSWMSSLLAFWEKFVSFLPFDFQHKVRGSFYFPWAMRDLCLRTQEQIHFKGWLQAEEKWLAPDTAPVGYWAFIPQICFEILQWDPFLCLSLYLPPPIHSLPVSLCQ